MAAMMLAGAKDAPTDARAAPSASRRGAGWEAGRRRLARHRRRRPSLARDLTPLLLELLEKLGSRTAFFAAVVAWAVALVLFLGCFEVVGR